MIFFNFQFRVRNGVKRSWSQRLFGRFKKIAPLCTEVPDESDDSDWIKTATVFGDDMYIPTSVLLDYEKNLADSPGFSQLNNLERDKIGEITANVDAKKKEIKQKKDKHLGVAILTFIVG